MPVIVNSEHPHPFLPSLRDPQAIGHLRATHQDIRPLEILIVNLMADKLATERQLVAWLGNTPIQVNLTFATTDAYHDEIVSGARTPTHTPKAHILDIYNPFGAVKGQKFDGFLLTGVNAKKRFVEDEDYWHTITEILDWSDTHAFSSLFLCWGGKAGLKHFHGINSYKGAEKLSGVFTHHTQNDSAQLLRDLPDQYPIPVSRWKSPRREDILRTEALEIVADSPESGPNIIAETHPFGTEGQRYARRLYMLCHPEYERDTLEKEFERDRKTAPDTPVPAHYFPSDSRCLRPQNTWRHTGMIYTRWVDMIYQATPAKLASIPHPC